MKKSTIAITMTIMSFVMVAVSIGFVIATNNQNTTAGKGLKVKEVPIKGISDGVVTVNAARSAFDLKGIITGKDYNFNTYVFRGKIISRKEYEFSWTDDEGQEWGPFSRSILEVHVNKEYHGKSPVKGKNIRVLYPYSLSAVFNDSVNIEENSEYVFANAWVLDEKYTDYVAEYAPDDRFESEKYADVIMGSTWNSLFPIDKGKVMLYHGYFEHDEEAMGQVLPYDSVDTDKLTSPHSLESGDFIAMNMSDFEKNFLTLFEHLDQLPASELQQ